MVFSIGTTWRAHHAGDHVVPGNAWTRRERPVGCADVECIDAARSGASRPADCACPVRAQSRRRWACVAGDGRARRGDGRRVERLSDRALPAADRRSRSRDLARTRRGLRAATGDAAAPRVQLQVGRFRQRSIRATRARGSARPDSAHGRGRAAAGRAQRVLGRAARRSGQHDVSRIPARAHRQAGRIVAAFVRKPWTTSSLRPKQPIRGAPSSLSCRC
jgi:hypothetical protein